MPNAMEWGQVAGSLFIFGWSCIGVYVAKTLHDIGVSIQELNIKVAVVVERDITRGEQYEDLKERVFRLEERD